MHNRRKKSKILPILFLFLQIIALFLLSYLIYFLFTEMGVSSTLVLMILLIGNIFAIMKFFARYVEIKNRTRYMDYEHFGKKGKV